MSKTNYVWILGLFLIVLTACSQITTPSGFSKSKIAVSKTKLQGYITDLKINGDSFQIGTSIVVSGNFHAEFPGNYYIEIGLPENTFKALAVLKASQSACDQNVHYAGVWANDLTAGDVVPFELSVKDYGKTGKYTLIGGVYPKCGAGSDIAVIEPIPITITSPPPQIIATPPTNSNTNPPQPTAPTEQCTPSGSLTELWIRRYGSKDASDNSKPRVIGRFQSNAPCSVTYYIEAGMLQSSFKPLVAAPLQQLSKISGVPSACDGNTHFSGLKVTLNKGDIVNFQLFPDNYGNTGRYVLQGGAYYNNGFFCGNADVASFPSQEILFLEMGGSIIDNSWVRVI